VKSLFWGRVRISIALSVAVTALAGTRLRIEEGARPHQTRLSSSNAHTCAVLDDGTVRCWGDNTYGQIGDGTTLTPKLAAVQVSGLANIISVSAGYSHTCALHAFGAVFCWGDNTYGEVGDGTSNNRKLTPVQVKGLDNVTAVAAGQGFTCGLRANGTVWCWGNSLFGELGNGTSGTTAGSLTPVQVKTTSPAIAVTAGQFHACALLLDSHSGAIVQCWGSNQKGQLGDGTYQLRSVPVTVAGLNDVLDVAAGAQHTCALVVSSGVQCWGTNADGQIGVLSLGSVPTPAPVVVVPSIPTPQLLTNAVAISAGGNHSCAILADGSIRCWGDDTYGQLGDSLTNNQRFVANTAVLGINDGLEIVSGAKHTCAIDTVSFTGRCWGDNTTGQLGNGTKNPASIPNTVAGVPGITGIGGRGIRAEFDRTCARRGNGTFACWGDPEGPNPVSLFPVSDTVSLALGSGLTCAVQSSGIAFCPFDFEPDTHRGFPENTLSMSLFGDHQCSIGAGGASVCVGFDQLAQTRSGLSRTAMIATGSGYACGLLVDGTVHCWGDNTAGQLGIGSVGGFFTSPVQVQGLSSIVAITASTSGSSFMCALSAIGTVSCWGAGGQGQLGNGNILPAQPFAQPVFGITNAVAVTAGASHACALLADGSAQCWGSDSSLQLGGRDTTSIQTTPVPVISSIRTINGLTFAFPLSAVAAISAGYSHTCSIQASGQPLCWGDNSVGEIGNGTQSTTLVARPTSVNSFTANVNPAVSLKSSGRIAIVTALMNCPTGGEAHISLTLEQGLVSGAGTAVAACESGLTEVPITVATQGPADLQTGAATAKVEAVVKSQGAIMEDQHWTRAVIIGLQN
jgi:alpha-tubulin suppressor-like RCC1 family protein